MNRYLLKNIALAFLAVGVLGALYPVYLWTHAVEIERNEQLAALLSGPVDKAVFSQPTKFDNCQIRGPLPDSDCTPGAVFEDVTLTKICTPGYTKTVRSVSTSLRKKVFAQYNIEYKQPYGSYEADHLIPLSLGGNNDIANLFPEAASPYPGFKEKDVVENYLHEEVCARRIALSVAQEKIANDWFLIYSNLSIQTIQELKNKYRSWAANFVSQ